MTSGQTRPPRQPGGALGREQIGQTVRLAGWVHKRRDFGGVLFIDLRDRSGLVQVVFQPDLGDVTAQAAALTLESVIEVSGEVIARSDENVNPNMPTGEIEVRAQTLEVLSTCDELPLQPASKQPASEESRLQWRYLDLRRQPMREALAFRSNAVRAIRDVLHDEGFWDVETPILTRSTPEGARDYLVPSRVHPGEFYALPQSPQMFKQILMVGGIEKYYQIARCFRDEDLRADRQPEFTQVDIEMSFVEPDDVMLTVEKVMHSLADLAGWKIDTPFERISWQQAMDEYGSDAPDRRYGMKIVDLTAAATDSSFVVFKSAVEAGGVVRGIAVEGAAGYTRKQLDGLTERAKKAGAGGLVWIKREEAGPKGPPVKALGEETGPLLDALGVKTGDLALIVAGPLAVVRRALGRLRSEVAAAEGLIPEGRHEFCWVTNFPLLEWDEEMNRWFSCHHPFTSPDPRDLDKLESDPGSVRARAYDLVLDGVEIGGGSIRIHRSDVQQRVFGVLGIDEKEARERFGFLLDALRFGAPPHGGIALGLDRMVALLLGHDSIREVIAFPKTTSASCLMTEAPSSVDADQISELGLALKKG